MVASCDCWSEYFCLPVPGKTWLTGQLDLPTIVDSDKQCPVVVMVPGTGLFDRDVRYGNSDTDADCLFKVLSDDLLTHGIATARFDCRGVVSSSDQSMVVSDDIRSAVTWQTQQSDIFAVFDYARNHPAIDRDRIVVFAHSEGTLHVGRLVGAGRINPVGLVFLGMVAESPASVIRWQFCSRLARDQIDQWDVLCREGLSISEVSGLIEGDELQALRRSLVRRPPIAGSWSAAKLTRWLEVHEYPRIREEWMAQADSAPFRYSNDESAEIFASFSWWKSWLMDDSPAVIHLQGYRGKLFVHLGEVDGATPVSRQRPLLERLKAQKRCQVHINVHAGMGHALGCDTMVGPMCPSARHDVVQSIVLAIDGAVNSRT